MLLSSKTQLETKKKKKKNLIFAYFFFPFFNGKVWHTASLYHLVHTAALVAAPVTKHPNIVSSSPLFFFF